MAEARSTAWLEEPARRPAGDGAAVEPRRPAPRGEPAGPRRPGIPIRDARRPGRLLEGWLPSVGPRPPWWLVVPAALVALAMVLPVAYLFIRTAGAWDRVAELLLRPSTWAIAARSLGLVAAVTATGIGLAVPLAWLVVRTDLPGRRFWSVATVLPLAIPSYVGSFLYVVAAGPHGLLQRLLAPLGVQRLPDLHGFWGAYLVMTLFTYPYILLPVRAALARLDPALEEASLSLGRGRAATFWTVILPQLRPAILSGARLVALYTLAEFGAVATLRYETFTWAIYVQYQAAFDRATAGGLALVLVAAALGILGLDALLRERWRYHRDTPGTPRPPAPVPLGPWRGPALVFCGAVVLLALGIPLGVLAYWAVRGALEGSWWELLGPATLNSLGVAALAAAGTVAAALPVAILGARYPGFWSGVVERASYVGFAIPGIVIALAMVFFGVRFLGPLYQTVALLVAAYGIVFLPTALGPLRASWLQVDPKLEEVARTLGRRPWQVLREVTLPLVRPGLLAGAGMVFLVTLKELPLTLILSPAGFSTLATSVWNSISEAFFGQAAVKSLLLVAASAASVMLILRREGEWEA